MMLPDCLVLTAGQDAVLCTSKNASSSMATGATRIEHYEDLPERIHTFLRDPIDRIYSTYRFFHKLIPGAVEWANRAMTWEEFVNIVLADELKDPHWERVSETIERLGRPVIPHLLEHMDEEFPWKLDKRENTNSVYYDADLSYRADELREHYAEDYALREEARWLRKQSLES